MKKLFCIFTVISIILSCTPFAFANDDNITDTVQAPVYGNADAEQGDDADYTKDNENSTEAGLSVDEDITEGSEETETEAEIAWEYGLSEYKYSEIYDAPLDQTEPTEEEKNIASEADHAQVLTDEELQLQTMSAESGGWITCAAMTSARSDMSSVVIDDDIYTFGGTESGTVVTKTEVFDTETEIWSRKANMPEGRYKHSAVSLNGKVYICAGYDDLGNAVSDIDVYDVENNIWETNSIATPNTNTNYAAGVYNGELYIFGGKEEGASTRNAYKYNTETGVWTQLCSMPIDTNDGKAAATSYGFYILSGMDVMKYDNTENSVDKVDELPRTMQDYAFVVRDEIATSPYSGAFHDWDVLTVSGGRESSSSVSLNSVKARGVADFAFTEDWVPEWYNDLRLIRGLSCHNMVIANGYIYVFGGQTAPNQEQRIMFKRSNNEFHDDYPDDNVYDMLIGRYAYGSINHSGDFDKFRFTPTESGKYEIQMLKSIQSNNMGYQIYIEVYNEQGKCIAAEWPSYLGGIYMEAGKTYMIQVADTSYTYSGNYFFQVHMVYDDAPDTLDEATEIQTETRISRTFLGRLDIDCMYFNIPVTGMYDIETVTNGRISANVIIHDEEQKVLYNYKYKTSGNNTANVRLNKGKYYITVSNSTYDEQNPGYTIKISNTAVYKQMNKARYRHSIAAVGGRLYAVGGLNSEYDAEMMIEAYTPSTGMWERVTQSSNMLRQGTAAIAEGSKIYLVGGVNDASEGAMEFSPLKDSIMIYDTENDTWTGTGDLGMDRERVGLAVKDGDIYIAGGRSYSPTAYSDEIQIFDTSTNTLTEYSASLPAGIVDPQIFFSGDTMYVAGGVDSEGCSGKVYALENGAWVQKASMPYESIYMRGKSFNGNFFAAAVNASGNVDILKYDTAEDEWTILYANYIEGRSYYGVEIMNGFMYMTGGYSITEDSVMNDMYFFDVAAELSSMDTAVPVRMIGFEYEQTVTGDIVNAPEITGVNARVVDESKGIYELYLNDDDYICDTRSTPFFFWSAREGMFRALEDDYRRVMFYADPGTGDRQVKVIVGIGDGRGYVDKKAFLLDGNSETE